MSSPMGDLAIVVTKTETKFYEAREKVPENLFLSSPTRSIVMVQWSAGTHFGDWTAQLGRITGQLLLEPVVRVKPTAK